MKNQNLGDCLKKRFNDLRKSLASKRRVEVFLRRVDTPMHTMIFLKHCREKLSFHKLILGE